jgi:hypothetical protein
LQHIDAWLEDGAPATTRMRDLQFWTEFYWSRDGERRQEAIRIRRALGRNPALKSNPRINISRSAHYERHIDQIEAQQGEKRPPTPEYLRALARAKALMSPERKAA